MSAVHQGGVGAPNELATFRVHGAVVDFVEQSVWGTRNCAASNPRYVLRISQADVGQDRRGKSFFFFRNSEKLKRESEENSPISDRSGKFLLGSSGISNFWPSIVTGLKDIDYGWGSDLSGVRT